MVRDQEVDAETNRLVDHLFHRVDREQHAAHRIARVAADSSDGIPIGRKRRRVLRLERGHHLRQGWGLHARRLANR